MRRDALRPIMEDCILYDRRHQDYQRTIDLATRYDELTSGKNLEKHLEIFDRRESPLDYQKRLKLTTQNLSAAFSSVFKKFNRPGRLQSIKREIKCPTNTNKFLENMEQAMAGFPLGGFESFLYSYFSVQGLIDPNSHMVLQFKDYRGSVRPYCVFFPSNQCIDYEYNVFGELEYLVVNYTTTSITEKNKRLTWQNFIGFGGEEDVMFVEVRRGLDVNTGPMPKPEPDTVFTGRDGEKDTSEYNVYFFQPEFNTVEAVRLGYLPDRETDNRTRISPLEPAMDVALEAIRMHSNKVLSAYLHCFPQKVQRTPICDYVNAADHCSGGKMEIAGTTCPSCKGTGRKTMTQPDDAIYLDLDQTGASGNPDLKLDDIVRYVSPEIETLREMRAMVTELEQKIYYAVFSSEPASGSVEAVTVTQDAATATEISKQREDITDELLKYAEGFEVVYLYLGRLIVQLFAPGNDEGYDLVYEMPKDMKLLTLDELRDSLQKAIVSGAASFIIEQIQADIAEKMYVGDPQALKKFKIKAKLVPFMGMTQAAVTTFIANKLVRREDAIAWANQDIIFGDLENAYTGADPFYDQDFKVIERAYDARLAEIIATLEEENPPVVPVLPSFGTPRTDPNANPANDPNNPTPAN